MRCFSRIFVLILFKSLEETLEIGIKSGAGGRGMTTVSLKHAYISTLSLVTDRREAFCLQTNRLYQKYFQML